MGKGDSPGQSGKPTLNERIKCFNQGFDPKLRSLKYAEMRRDPFGFFRGTCHLFYEDWPASSALNEAPLAWLCGDLHPENFGGFVATNGRAYFDITDFDEAALAPCTWDLARLLTGVLVGTRQAGVGAADADALCTALLDGYVAGLIAGRADRIDGTTTVMPIRELLDDLPERKRKDWLDERTVLQGKNRRLRLNPPKKHPVWPVSDAQRDEVLALMEAFAARQPEPQFFRVLDVAQRVAGTGSLGVARYLLLVEGKGSPDRNRLLDLKQARSSSLQPYLQPGWVRPDWSSEAERVVAVQRLVGVAPVTLLEALPSGDTSYRLRELRPTEDGLSLDRWAKRIGRLHQVMGALGKATAWDQLRGSGHNGAATADTLRAFAGMAHEDDWRGAVLDYARGYSRHVEEDWREFWAHGPTS